MPLGGADADRENISALVSTAAGVSCEDGVPWSRTSRVYALLPLLQCLPNSHTISVLHHLLGLLWVVSLFGEVQNGFGGLGPPACLMCFHSLVSALAEERAILSCFIPGKTSSS